MVFEKLAGEDFAYLATVGRVTGRSHRIEIWFALEGGRLYMLAGGADRADWVRNIRANGRVRVRVGSRSVNARGRLVEAGTAEDRRARELLDSKYMGWRAGRRLSAWARGARAVAVDLPTPPPSRHTSQ